MLCRQAGLVLGGGWELVEREARVRELVRTNDAVLLSAVQALLQAANIPHLVLDQNMSVLEGSLGILPRRILVAAEQVRSARRLLADAGLAHELSPNDP
jgi:hypothetical protein